MESALYAIYTLVFVSEISLVRWYVNNSCVNSVRPHLPRSILYILLFLCLVKRYPPLSVANVHLQKSFCVKYLGVYSIVILLGVTNLCIFTTYVAK